MSRVCCKNWFEWQDIHPFFSFCVLRQTHQANRTSHSPGHHRRLCHVVMATAHLRWRLCRHRILAGEIWQQAKVMGQGRWPGCQDLVFCCAQTDRRREIQVQGLRCQSRRFRSTPWDRGRCGSKETTLYVTWESFSEHATVIFYVFRLKKWINVIWS